MADSTRWWEHYYVRYFVGAAFAVPLMWCLLHSPLLQPMQELLTGKTWLTASVLATAGLAFCYVASAPILLLHAMRGRIPDKGGIYNAIALLVGLLTLFCMTLLICPWLQLQLTPKDFLRVPFYAVVTVQGLMLFSCFGKLGIEKIVVFYVELAKHRSESTSQPSLPQQTQQSQQQASQASSVREARDEYIESYRHLREHGNALMILLMEVALAAALWTASKPTEFIGLLVVWFLPATTVWFVATWLERSLPRVR